MGLFRCRILIHDAKCLTNDTTRLRVDSSNDVDATCWWDNCTLSNVTLSSLAANGNASRPG